MDANAFIGEIHSLYLKHKRGCPPVRLAADDFMLCEAGFGISGDVHASRLSPRQVLVTVTPELESLDIEPGALQENIVIRCDPAAGLKPGAAIITASGVTIRLTMFCEPCRLVADVEPNLAKLVYRRGILGYVEKGGEIRQGDAVELVLGRYDPLADSPYQRFLDFIATIPAGRVVRYADVAMGIGVADSFVRALPGYIKRSLDLPLPFHRIANAQGRLPGFIPGQASALEAEGITVSEDRKSISLKTYLWQG